MKVTIERDEFLKGLNSVLGVVDRRGTMPILSHARLETNGTGIFISATDLELSYRGFIPAEVHEVGEITVPAHQLTSLIKEMPRETLFIKTDVRDRVQIRTDNQQENARADYEFCGLPAEQFPPIPELGEEGLVEVDARVLKAMADKVSYAACNDNLQYHLSCIFWEKVEKDGVDHLRLTATDGHRLTFVDRAMNLKGLELSQGVLVPLKGVRELTRFIAKQEKVFLGLKEGYLILQAGANTLNVRLVEKNFPDYRRIIPEDFAYRFSLRREDFSRILKRASQLISERFRALQFELYPDRMRVSVHNAEVGEGEEWLGATLDQGDSKTLPLSIGFNARYLLEPIAVLEPNDEKVILEINDPDSPARLGGQNNDHLYILMPLSL